MTECNHNWVYTNYSHNRKCALCGKEEILVYEPTDKTCMRYVPRWIEKLQPQIELKTNENMYRWERSMAS